MDLNKIIEKAISDFEDKSLEKSIVEKSTPVISFGDFRKAKVLTVGINPSYKEFRNDSNKELLKEGFKRLEDFESLNVNNRSELNSSHGKLIFKACCNYFKENPYEWFNKLTPILNVVNSSYFDNSAAHIDLFPWATKQIWRKLPKSEQIKILNNGKYFFKNQIKKSSCELILLNGRAVKEGFESILNLKLNYKEIPGLLNRRAWIVFGSLDNNKKITVLKFFTTS